MGPYSVTLAACYNMQRERVLSEFRSEKKNRVIDDECHLLLEWQCLCCCPVILTYTSINVILTLMKVTTATPSTSSFV
jgi:hypothetical protein